MARPTKVQRTVEKRISLPQDLVVQVDLELFSQLEGKVPFGAWQKYLTELIQEDLKKRAVVSNFAVEGVE